LKWVFRTSGRIYADAAVTEDGEMIYVASHDHYLYAVDADGKKKWEFDTGGKIWTSPTVDERDRVYIGTDADALFALESTGELAWKFVTFEKRKPGEPGFGAGKFDVDTSPLILEDGTIVFGCDFKLIALKPLTGELRWVFTAGKGRDKVFSSAAVSPLGTIFFGTQGDFFFALNQSASVLWHFETGGDNDSTPVVDVDGNVYFGSDDGIVRAFSPVGRELWKTKTGAPVRAPLGLYNNEVLYVPTFGNEPFVAALDRETGRELWRFYIQPGEGDFYGIQSGVTTDMDGYAYFGGRDGFVYCISPQGKLVWKFETGDHVDSGAVLGPDGTLYIGSDDRRLYAFGAP